MGWLGPHDGPDALDEQRAGADEVRESRALIRREQRVHTAERLRHVGLHTLLALHTQLASFVGFRRVEAVAGNRVGERGERSPIVDRRLRTLGLELAQDRRELLHLRVLELELPREESQGPAHAEATARLVAESVVPVRVGERELGGATAAPWAAGPHTRTHDLVLSLAAANRARRVFMASAPCLTPERSGERLGLLDARPLPCRCETF